MAELAPDGRLLRANDALRTLLRTDEQLEGRSAAELGLVPADWQPPTAGGSVHLVVVGDRSRDQLFVELSRRAYDLAVVLDADGRLTYVSPAVRHLLGYRPDEIVSKLGWDFVHPDDVPLAQQTVAEARTGHGSRSAVIRVRDAKGDWHWVEGTVANLLDTAVAGIVCNLRDVTDRVEAEQALRISERRYRAIVDTASEGIWAVDRTGRTLHVNARTAEILGIPLAELYARPAPDLLSEEQARPMRERLAGRASRGVERYEVTYQHPTEGRRVIAVSATPLEAQDGEIEGSFAMITDVTEARRSEEELRHQALHDALTGLPNRALLLDRLEHALARETRSTAVVFLDLDHFKLVNDSRGHDVGDELLIEVARRLQDAARPADTVARFGGDEFVVVCEDVDEGEAEALAGELLAALQEPFELPHGPVHARASFGVALSPPQDAGELLRFADTAMYAAKAAGRGRVRRFDASLAERAEERYALAEDLRVALAEDALELHFQPVIDLRSGRTLGVEALVRWDHPVHGQLQPGRFVPVAELSGLAPELDDWVLKRALREMANLLRDGGMPPDARVSVNLSAGHLSDVALEERALSATEAAELRPSDVILEITEGAIMNDAEGAVEQLRRLREHGFGIAIDDFGTGYSSLAYLRQLPVTALKVDRSFVAHITEDSDALAIVASIIDLARAVGVGTVAEGVETPEQAALLRQLGCAAGQGWLWSAAVPPQQLSQAPRWSYAAADEHAQRTPRRRSRPHVGPEHGREELLALHRQGASLATIAAALNRAGYRTPTGPRWHATSVARAITDAAYPALGDG